MFSVLFIAVLAAFAQEADFARLERSARAQAPQGVLHNQVFDKLSAYYQRNDFAHLERSAQAQAPQLYKQVFDELSEYYQRTDFADPEHDSGWYRVDDFLTWVKTNEKNLLEQKLNIGKESYSLGQILPREEEYLRHTVWTFLGIKYLQYKAKSPNRSVFSFYYCKGNNCAVERPNCTIHLGLGTKVPVLLLNTGLHEATHVLNGCSATFLSEAATIRAQNLWGLPITTNLDPRLGVRDLRVLLSANPNAVLSYLEQEYAFFFLAPLLQDNAFNILYDKKESISFCRFLSDKLMPEFGTIVPDYDGALKRALSEWIGKKRTTQAFEDAYAGKLVTLGGPYTKEQVLNFYKFYREASSGQSVDVSQIQARLAESGEELVEDSYWAYLSDARHPTLQFSQTPDLEQVLAQHFAPNAITPQVTEFFKRTRDLQSQFDRRCATIDFMYKVKDILNDLAGEQSTSKVPPGYM